jgi:Icc-related predicted phosphoesterase
MRILVVADTVVRGLSADTFNPELTQGVDLILSCGDLPPEYLTFLTEKTGLPLYYIKGNHDIRYRQTPPGGCLHIHRKIVSYNGIRLLGLGGSRWYNGGMNQYSEPQMKKYIRLLWFSLLKKRGVDILLTHAPPRWIGDAEDLCHRGFKCFRTLLEKYQPLYMVHGHIHRLFEDDTQRKSSFGVTQVINCYGYYILDF